MSYLYRTGNGRNNIAFTTTANSSTKYLRRTSSGRNNIVWTTIPQGSTYNILNRTGTGRNNIAWSNLYIPIPGVALSTKSPGDIVKIKENGTFVDFLVLIHNYPASGRTLLLRKDLYDTIIPFNNESNFYFNGSNIMTWLNSTYLNTIDSIVRNNISNVTIRSNDSNISTKVFLLSAVEYIGISSDDSITDNTPWEGTKIDYFYASTRQACTSNGTYRSYYTRTRYYSTVSWRDMGLVVIDGKYGDLGWSGDYDGYYTRPAFTLSSSILVNSSGQITG